MDLYRSPNPSMAESSPNGQPLGLDSVINVFGLLYKSIGPAYNGLNKGYARLDSSRALRLSDRADLHEHGPMSRSSPVGHR